MSDKISPQHLARKAMLYIRQSSTYQVSHNLENQRLQYAMQDRLHHLGWQEIEVVDEDLGRSAAGMVTRAGFERMVAEVCLGKVGAVAAREVSRFARNSREWQQLVEVCRVVDTVLVDLETVYSPRHSNDRLLLGLKGSLNEYELDLLRQRSVEARRAKAQRGELLVMAPVGYIKTDAPHFEKDPDRRVQDAVTLVFRKFVELGTVRQTLWWFVEHGVQLPVPTQQGDTAWKRPTYAMLYRMLTNPLYGGAYAYGKTERTLQYDHGEPRASTRRKPRARWLALIPHAHEGYVSWEEFERIQQAMTDNLRGSRRDHARAGPVSRTPAVPPVRPDVDGLVHWPRSRCAPLFVRARDAGQWGTALSWIWRRVGRRGDGQRNLTGRATGRGGGGGGRERRSRASAGRRVARLATRARGGAVCGAARTTAIRCGGPGEPLGGRRIRAALEPGVAARR